MVSSLLESLSPLLGLYYPASDIPQAARRLFSENVVRFIPDVSYRSVPLIPYGNLLTDRPLDLSFSFLRTVSPCHIQYLKNMGVGASMTLSLIQDKKLWGLIACHHQTAKYVNYEMRTVCEFLGQVMSLELAVKVAVPERELELVTLSTSIFLLVSGAAMMRPVAAEA